MDRLDKLSVVLIVVLTTLATGMVVRKGLDDKKSCAVPASAPEPGPDQKVYEEVKVLIDAAHYEDALKKLQTIMERYPEKLESSIYMARIYYRQGNMDKAISLCRNSIEKNPGLVELASDNLHGLVQKGIIKLKREKKLKPDDERVSSLLQDFYFCQRRLGQGCE